MSRPTLEVADIFHRHGAAWRRANAGHASLGQLKAMSAIVSCRTAALGGHVMRCEDCGHSRIAYNSLYGDSFVKLSMPIPTFSWFNRSTAAACWNDPRGARHWRKASRRDLVCGWIRKGPGP